MHSTQFHFLRRLNRPLRSRWPVHFLRLSRFLQRKSHCLESQSSQPAHHFFIGSQFSIQKPQSLINLSIFKPRMPTSFGYTQKIVLRQFGSYLHFFGRRNFIKRLIRKIALSGFALAEPQVDRFIDYLLQRFLEDRLQRYYLNLTQFIVAVSFDRSLPSPLYSIVNFLHFTPIFKQQNQGFRILFVQIDLIVTEKTVVSDSDRTVLAKKIITWTVHEDCFKANDVNYFAQNLCGWNPFQRF